MITIKLIEHNSSEYWQVVDLRDRILRKPLGLHFTKEQLSVENSNFHIAAYIKDKLVGTLMLSHVDEQTIQMKQVAVDDTEQGKGIGRDMVRFAEKFSKEKGYNKMYVHARQTAIQFYKKLNYVIVGEGFHEVNIPHFAVEKFI